MTDGHDTPSGPKRDHWGTSRAQIVQGLRDLAAFLESRTDLPIPNVADLCHSVIEDTDEAERVEVDRIALILGVPAQEKFNGQHYVAAANFGPVIYRAIAITEEEMARYRAESTSIDVVRPEQWPI
jgi:hypothetical protein